MWDKAKFVLASCTFPSVIFRNVIQNDEKDSYSSFPLIVICILQRKKKRQDHVPCLIHE